MGVNNYIPSKEELEKHLKIKLGKRINVVVNDDIFICLLGIWYIIPKGFKSDGGSLPWLFTFFLDRLDPRILLFSILHDYFYRVQFVSRLFADNTYKNGLYLTANSALANTFYLVLRSTGWFAWWKNKHKGLENFPDAMLRLKKYLKGKK